MAMGWGLALFLLTISGVWIYWLMRRPGATGIKRIFWMIPLAVAAGTRADSPFITDDPEFSPGWEIKAGVTTERNSGATTFSEVLDMNYAIVPTVRLNVTTSAKHVWPARTGTAFGYADTEFKIKWRFQDADPKTDKPSLGFAPKVFFPTADKTNGLGDGVYRFQIPFQFGKTIGKTYHFAEVGYQFAFDRAATDSVYGGYGILYNFNAHWALGTELFATVPVDRGGDWQLQTTLGAIYTFNDNFSIKASISESLRSTHRGGPNPAAVFYLVWNF